MLKKEYLSKITRLFSALIGLGFLNTVEAGSPMWTITPLTATTISVPANGAGAVQYQVTNNTSRSQTLAMNAITGVSQLASGPGICPNPFTLSSKSSCVLSLAIDGSKAITGDTNGPVVCISGSQLACYRPSVGNTLKIIVTPSQYSLLTTSPSTLALKNLGINRTITVTNNGTIAAQNVSYSSLGLPVGTHIDQGTSSCHGVLAPSASCTINVIPGNATSSACSAGQGSRPTPGSITVTADNAFSPTSSSVFVLDYGCIYQGGYLFAINDSTPATESIGGTTMAQSSPPATTVVWSSNGIGSVDVSNDVIPGIDVTSTTSVGSPSEAAADASFSSSYGFPYPSGGSQACNGLADGACNSGNIVFLYNTYITNYGVTNILEPGPTNPSYYAAGICSQYKTNASGTPCTAGSPCYENWYLPAICEMNDNSGSPNCPPGIPNIVSNLPNLVGCSNIPACVLHAYWSSTEATPGHGSASNAWSMTFAPAGSSYAGEVSKSVDQQIRCARNLTA